MRKIFTGPQNVDVSQASDTRRVAIILVDTASAHYPGNAAISIGIVMSGRPSSSEWTTQQSAEFRSASGRWAAALQGQTRQHSVSGSFQLWILHRLLQVNTKQSNWLVKGNLFQIRITAIQEWVDFDQIDTLVCVMRSFRHKARAKPNLCNRHCKS